VANMQTVFGWGGGGSVEQVPNSQKIESSGQNTYFLTN
jgi:hypothetical protein